MLLKDLPSVISHWRERSLGGLNVSSDMKEKMAYLGDNDLEKLVFDFQEGPRRYPSATGNYVNGAYWEWCRRQAKQLLQGPKLVGHDSSPLMVRHRPLIIPNETIGVVFLVVDRVFRWRGSFEAFFDLFPDTPYSLWASDYQSRLALKRVIPYASVGQCDQWEDNANTFRVVANDSFPLLYVTKESVVKELANGQSFFHFGRAGALADEALLQDPFGFQDYSDLSDSIFSVYRAQVQKECEELLVLDAMSGNGMMAMALARKEEVARVDCVELNPVRAQTLQKNVEILKVAEKVRVKPGGICGWLKILHSYSIVYVDPPASDLDVRSGSFGIMPGFRAMPLSLKDLCYYLLGVGCMVVLRVPVGFEVSKLNAPHICVTPIVVKQELFLSMVGPLKDVQIHLPVYASHGWRYIFHRFARFSYSHCLDLLHVRNLCEYLDIVFQGELDCPHFRCSCRFSLVGKRRLSGFSYQNPWTLGPIEEKVLGGVRAVVQWIIGGKPLSGEINVNAMELDEEGELNWDPQGDLASCIPNGRQFSPSLQLLQGEDERKVFLRSVLLSVFGQEPGMLSDFVIQRMRTLGMQSPVGDIRDLVDVLKVPRKDVARLGGREIWMPKKN